MGRILTILLSSVQCIQNKQLYFADRLYDSMKVGKTGFFFYCYFVVVVVIGRHFCSYEM